MTWLPRSGDAHHRSSGRVAPWIAATALLIGLLCIVIAAVRQVVARRRTVGRRSGPGAAPIGGEAAVQNVPPERPIEYRSVSAHLEATAQNRPGQVALRTGSETLTYRQLLDAVRSRAAAEGGAGAHRNRAALVSADLSAATISRILGMFASKTVVVAVDPATPENRIEKIAAILAEHGYHLSADGTDPVHDAVADVDDITSIQFTSGSTGSPKAVLHTNGIWLADAQLLNDRFGMADGRKVALCMPISFAGGLNVLIASLLGGAEVVGVDPREHSARDAFTRIRTSGAEIIACTPTFVDALHTAAQRDTLPDVRRIVATGEPVQARHVRLARELAPNAIFTNWVGSTETLGIASYDIPPTAPLPRGVVPVGIPAPHKRIDIDDAGTVSITGRYLGTGYLDGAATAATFATNPDGTITYRGGDSGRWDAHGNLMLSGRAGSAVKIRGYLVEPSEIEAALASYEDIREAAVVTDHTDPPTLTAYVAPSTTVRTPSVADLRTRLHRDLPPWMVPTHIVILAALPRGDRGKVDRGALPKPQRPAFEAPRGAEEKAVARQWAELLHVESVSRTDSFYALGGDSLSAVQMLSALTASRGIRLNPSELAAAPTVVEFAALLTANRTTPAQPGRPMLNPTTVALRPISESTAGAPLFCFTGAGASSLCFLPLAERIGTDTAVYAFEPSGLRRRTAPDWSIGRAVRRHLSDLRRIQPNGPYVLVGHSLGAHIAVETARQLEAVGEQVDLVVMLDPWLSPRVARAAQQQLPNATVTLQTDSANGFKTWWRRQRMVPLAGLLVGGAQRRTLAVEEVGMIAGFRHRPQPWNGRAMLIVSHLNRDDPRLWSQVLPGQVQRGVLECDHHSIVREPHISAVVQMIAAAG